MKTKNKSIFKLIGTSYRQNLAMFTIVFGLVCLSVYSTYGLYMKSMEVSDVPNINTIKTYDVGISTGSSFIIAGENQKIVNFKVKSNNASMIKYQLYYSISSGTASDLEISQLVTSSSEDLITSGTLSAGQIKNIPLYLKNNGTNDINLSINVRYYFIGETLSLETNQLSISTKKLRENINE